MTGSDPRADYTAFTRNLIDDLRAHGGEVTSGPFKGRPVLLLTTTGAKTGKPRLAPLVYSRDAERLVVAASKGGAPTHPAWYANLITNPIVTVEAGGEVFQARAIVADGEDRERLWRAHVAQNPAFAGYAQKTSRVIPVISLERLA
jgi:deazaflavin-dependent oxidoreductase (nitroreductase family)